MRPCSFVSVRLPKRNTIGNATSSPCQANLQSIYKRKQLLYSRTNVRFGDPETQVTIPLIESDLGVLLLATAEGNLSSISVEFSSKSAATVVLASEGYPASSKVGREIKGADSSIEEGDILGLVHHAGTRISDDGRLISSGGRVLATTAIAPDLRTAVEASYAVMEEIELPGSHYRSDIGHRAL